MLILGIETSCDETSAALLEIYPVKSGKVGTKQFDGVKIKVLSDIVSSQIKLHSKFGGVVPSLAAREHNKNLSKVIKKALVDRSLSKVDLIAVTAGPGLVSSLLVGTAFAKTLAWKFKKPIIGVNHMEGHVFSNFLGPIGENTRIDDKRKIFPALNLIVSGGHTQLVLMKDFGKYKLLGETRDDAAGEAFDKIARILGLGYPGGPAIEQVADSRLLVAGKDQKKRTRNQKLATSYQLPRPMINSKNYDFSFAGLKTAALYLARDIMKEGKTKNLDRQTAANIAAEAQEAIVDVLVSKTVKAAEEFKVKSVMLSGGVSANKLLRQRLAKEVRKSSRNLKLFIPEMSYTTDNAAMIALAGYLKSQKSPPARFAGESVRRVRRAGKVPAKGGSASGGKNQNWEKVRADANWEIV